MPPVMSSSVLRVGGLSAAFAAALNGTMVMPLIVMALCRIPGIDEATATAVASAEIGGIALYCLLCPRLVRHAHWQVAAGGVLAMVAGQLLSHVTDSVATLSLARLLAGVGEGALFSLITYNVAAQAEAERIWGQINLVGGVCMGGLLYVLSVLPPQAGRGPIFLWLAAFGVALAPLILSIRPRGAASTGAAQAAPGASAASAASVAPALASRLSRSRLALVLVVVLLVYGVQAGQWAVSGYVGERARIAAETVGLFLALSSILGFVGAIVPSLTRNPARRAPLVALGFLILGASVYAFFNIAGQWPFLLSQIMINVGFYMLTPFLTGLLTENDPDGALVMRTLIIAMLGAGIGTALAGELFVSGGPGMFSVIAVGVVGLAWAGAMAVFNTIKRTKHEHEEAQVGTRNIAGADGLTGHGGR
ncbi:MFS transporter [Duganella radicis]|uniref:MFS transporter n=1 Tax=Duganella radicis TaxID=551988 RepID=A0A6L6PSL7_9BURK|nr:MFS transporter [Duganella radicis]MTV41225.1 MFS transporter [Duganella radicis]